MDVALPLYNYIFHSVYSKYKMGSYVSDIKLRLKEPTDALLRSLNSISSNVSAKLIGMILEIAA